MNNIAFKVAVSDFGETMLIFEINPPSFHLLHPQNAQTRNARVDVSLAEVKQNYASRKIKQR